MRIIFGKIENEGFNVQKNRGFNLEHAYTRDATASKVFYFLLQIAHLIAQLIEKGSLFRKAFLAGVGSAKNIAFRLLEAWCNLCVSAEPIHQMLDARCQVRFAPHSTNFPVVPVRPPKRAQSGMKPV